AIVEGDTKIREMLNITITIDHDMIDGGPLARFVDRMIELTESAFGLDEFA
ncbi:MAG TPA: dehydrogenase, partial [Thermoplasmatales archaeon]|nr:dehydrogenase [Thermoplasmatales archaeon]